MSEQESAAKFPLRIAVIAALVVVLGLLFHFFDLRPDLAHLEVSMLTGPEQGNYHALATRLSAAAALDEGKLHPQTTAGTVENLERLGAGCDAQFALVQDGVIPPDGVEMIVRLNRSESLLFIGKDADRFSSLAQLEGLHIGIGPPKSGTDRLAREVFAELDGLAVKLSNHAVVQQLDAVVNDALDLAVFVVDEDASLIREAVVKRGLQIASFNHLEAIARRHRHLSVGTIGAGQFDPVRVIPPRAKHVLRVDTLVVGNRCASHAQVIAMLSLMAAELPGLLEHNRTRGKSELYALSSASKAFFDNNGPDVFEMHVPWLVDIMPPNKWVYIATALSVLFNVMGAGHRFRLWRIDANRIKVDQRVRALLGARLTPEEIKNLEPGDRHQNDKVRAGIDTALTTLAGLRDRCRKQSVSALVPMGQEMAYRFQEDQIEEEITVLRRFRSRLSLGES
jgi:hypothetical protein